MCVCVCVCESGPAVPPDFGTARARAVPSRARGLCGRHRGAPRGLCGRHREGRRPQRGGAAPRVNNDQASYQERSGLILIKIRPHTCIRLCNRHPTTSQTSDHVTDIRPRHRHPTPSVSLHPALQFFPDPFSSSPTCRGSNPTRRGSLPTCRGSLPTCRGSTRPVGVAPDMSR